MKRIFLVPLCALLLLLTACSEPAATEQGDNGVFQPLFLIQGEKQDAAAATLFPLNRSNGFFYLHPKNDSLSAGFVSPARSLSCEEILSDGKGTILLCREWEKDRVFLLTDQLLYLIFTEGGASETPLPENFDPASAAFCGETGLLSVLDGRILLWDMALTDPRVAGTVADLPNFDRLLGASDDGKTVYYTRRDETGGLGIGAFPLGKSREATVENFRFDSVETGTDGTFLFRRALPDGGELVLYRDLDEGISRHVAPTRTYLTWAVSQGGTHFCGLRKTGETYTIEYWDGVKGTLLSSFSPEGVPTAISLSPDGKTVLITLEAAAGIAFATLKY